jgi:diguanylate cyclase (GGDEF)-like protein
MFMVTFYLEQKTEDTMSIYQTRLTSALKMELTFNDTIEQVLQQLKIYKKDDKKRLELKSTLADFEQHKQTLLATKSSNEERGIIGQINAKFDQLEVITDQLLLLHDEKVASISNRRRTLNGYFETLLDDRLQKDLSINDPNYAKKLEILAEIEINTHEMVSAVRGYVIKHEAFLKDRVVDSQQDAIYWFSQAEKLPLNEEEQNEIQLLKSHFLKMADLSDITIAREDKLSSKLVELDILADEINLLLNNKLQKINNDIILAERSLLSSTIEYAWIGLAVSTVLILLLARYLSKRFLKQLNQLIFASRKYAEGDLTYRVELGTDHELKDLATAFNDMAEKLSGSNIQMEALNAELETLSITDHLTQIFNRVHLDKLIPEQIEKSKRYKRPFSVIMIDIDHFKRVNDSFGHNVGDDAIVEFTQLIQANIRQIDIFGRWGGEEFLVICPEIQLTEAHNIAEKLRAMIEEHSFTQPQNMTASFGVTSYIEGDTVTSIFERVDRALYASKNNGRNRVEEITDNN